MSKNRSARGTVSARRKARPANPGIVPYREIPAFLRALRGAGAADAAKDALEWLILTATRTNETLDARLSDVSEKDATWTLSAERIKSIRSRVEPLSARALEILAACKKRHSSNGDYIFESAPGAPLNNLAMLVHMRRIRSTGVPHGFRYGFHRWAADRGHAPSEIAKASVEERRKVMDAWSKFCTSS
jgi:integrase